MEKTPKSGLAGLLRPADSIVVLVDHQPYQFTNLYVFKNLAVKIYGFFCIVVEPQARSNLLHKRNFRM